MAYIVRTFPLLASSAEVEAFAAEVKGPRGDQTAAFYRRYGIHFESWHVQRCGDSLQLLVATQVDDPDTAAPRYAASTEPYDVWFKQNVLRLTGVDPNVAPKGPPSLELFRWIDACKIAAGRP